MSIGRLSFSQEEQMQAARQPSASLPAAAAGSLSAASLSALKLSAPQQKAVDGLVQSFETKNGTGQPTPAQFQGLITQIGTLLTTSQQRQLQTMLNASGAGQPAAVVACNNPLLGEFDLINGSSSTAPSGSLQLFNYLDDGSGTAPSSSDPSVAASLWNFGATGAPVSNALI